VVWVTFPQFSTIYKFFFIFHKLYVERPLVTHVQSLINKDWICCWFLNVARFYESWERANPKIRRLNVIGSARYAPCGDYQIFSIGRNVMSLRLLIDTLYGLNCRVTLTRWAIEVSNYKNFTFCLVHSVLRTRWLSQLSRFLLKHQANRTCRTSNISSCFLF